jgi:hypothetical protein
MKYDVEMGSDTIIPSFIKFESAIQKLIGKIYRHIDSMASHKPFF